MNGIELYMDDIKLYMNGIELYTYKTSLKADKEDWGCFFEFAI